MSTIDPSGAVHGIDGRFTGYIAAESVEDLPSTDAVALSDLGLDPGQSEEIDPYDLTDASCRDAAKTAYDTRPTLHRSAPIPEVRKVRGSSRQRPNGAPLRAHMRVGSAPFGRSQAQAHAPLRRCLARLVRRGLRPRGPVVHGFAIGVAGLPGK